MPVDLPAAAAPPELNRDQVSLCTIRNRDLDPCPRYGAYHASPKSGNRLLGQAAGIAWEQITTPTHSLPAYRTLLCPGKYSQPDLLLTLHGGVAPAQQMQVMCCCQRIDQHAKAHKDKRAAVRAERFGQLIEDRRLLQGFPDNKQSPLDTQHALHFQAALLTDLLLICTLLANTVTPAETQSAKMCTCALTDTEGCASTGTVSSA